MAMYHVYILKSEKTGGLYKGQAKEVPKRLDEHNSGKTKSTRFGIPWRLVHTESFATREQAIERERYFKTAAGRRWIKQNVPGV